MMLGVGTQTHTQTRMGQEHILFQWRDTSSSSKLNGSCVYAFFKSRESIVKGERQRAEFPPRCPLWLDKQFIQYAVWQASLREEELLVDNWGQFSGQRVTVVDVGEGCCVYLSRGGRKHVVAPFHTGPGVVWIDWGEISLNFETFGLW